MEKIFEQYLSQIDKNYSALLRVFKLECDVAYYKLTDWDKKSGGDSLMYASSILSTVG